MSCRRSVFLGPLAALTLLALPALGAKGDDAALKAMRDAMEEDYLATNMSAAVAKLQNALKLCEKQGCSKPTLAKLHGALATVYSAGLGAHEDAVASFKRMLEADPDSKPQSAYVTGDVQTDYERAKAETKPGGEPGPAPAGKVAVLEEKPWPQQATYRPVPVYVQAPEGVEPTRVVVRYRSPGDQQWRELVIEKHKSGWGGYIPCAAVEKEGELAYFVTAFDANLDRVASAGSGENPRKVKLRGAIGGRLPSLPGALPPEECPRPVQGLSCETNDDCPAPKTCQNLVCADETTTEPKPEPEDRVPRPQNWLSLSFSPDVTIVSPSDDACSPAAQQDGELSCFFKGDVQYRGIPATGNANSLKGGAGLGTMRVLAGYDRLLGKRITLGARLGFAFGGPPERTDGKKFLPLHAEARGGYWFGKDPFAEKGVRPYVFLNGGLADTSAKLSTEVVEQAPSGAQSAYKLNVYRASGPGFAGGGVGVQYAVSKEMALVIEVGGRAMIPKFAPVIAPAVGFAYGL